MSLRAELNLQTVLTLLSLFRPQLARLSGADMDFSSVRTRDNLIQGPIHGHGQLVSIDDQSQSIQQQKYVVLIGNRKWIKDKNFIDIPNDIENKLLAQERRGYTAILVAVDGKKRRSDFEKNQSHFYPPL